MFRYDVVADEMRDILRFAPTGRRLDFAGADHSRRRRMEGT
jgi:hypothetical protein